MSREFQHPLFIRLSHWLNAIALTIMVASGLRIYNASPLFDFRIPDMLTLGGWLAGARQWHFFGMWVFFLNGVAYVLYNLLTRHGRSTTLVSRADFPGVVPMIQYYLRIRKNHPPAGKYNPLQKLTYTMVPLLAVGVILSGLSIYWPTQLRWLTAIAGGYDRARLWHFLFTCSLVGFTAGHLVMVVLAGWSNFVSMITGWKKLPPASEQLPTSP